MLSTNSTNKADSAEESFRAERIRHWERVAVEMPVRGIGSSVYHRRLGQVYAALIPAGLRVIEIGCGRGQLLASVRPEFGIGVDFSPAMVALAKANHSHLHFRCEDAHDLSAMGTFDFVILSDLVNDLWDVQGVLDQARRLLAPRGRIILNLYSRLWQLPLRLATMLGLSEPTLDQNWLTPQDMRNLTSLANCEVVRSWSEVLWPIPTPGIEPFCNRVLVKSWPFGVAAITNFFVIRATPDAPESPTSHSVSVIVPARNEAGHIDAIFERMPSFGASTQTIFVEGHSTDGTVAAIERVILNHPERRGLLLKQPGRGKCDAVRMGFAHATGDVLMILDADLTVAPEDLPRFYQALVTGKGDFVNGVRLVYPMEGRAMRFFNLVANKFFGWLFSWLLGQNIKDTLCGTKVLWRDDYARIAAARSYFGDFDPFGDFELLFGAARFNRKIVEMPVRYRERTYGTTNINRWRDGWLLFRMAAIAARRLKWV